MQLPSVLAAALARFLDEEGVPYCVLGHLARMRFVVCGAGPSRMASLLQGFCARHGLQLVQHVRRPEQVDDYSLGAADGEIWTVAVQADVLCRGQLIYRGEELLSDRCPPSGEDEGEQWYRAAAAKEFICHLLLCIECGEIDAHDSAHLSALWRLDSRGATAQVERFWSSEREGGVVLRAAVAGNWDAVFASTRALRAALAGAWRPAALLRQASARLHRWLYPSGLFVACQGVEDCYRRDLMAALCRNVPAPFSGICVLALQDTWTGRLIAADCSDGKRARLSKTAQRAAFLLEYLLRIRPHLVRARLVVLDVSSRECFATGNPHRSRQPGASLRRLLRHLPRPELWLTLKAPASVPRTLRATDTSSAARMKHRQRRGHVVVLQAGHLLEHPLAQLARALHQQLACRTARRLGLQIHEGERALATRLLLFFSLHSVPLLSTAVRRLFNSELRSQLPCDIRLPRPYGIFIHPETMIGGRVTIMEQVVIGSRDCQAGAAPAIGDDVYIGAGARIFGGVHIGQGAVIGANAVVTRDVPARSMVVGANRLVALARAARGPHAAEASIARFPGNVERAVRTQAR